MSDSYQTVYDATRSKISNGDVGNAIERVMSEANIGWHFEKVAAAAHVHFSEMFAESTRPSVLYRPTLGIDGNQFFFLYGSNLMEGCAGFGDTAALAALDFDNNWLQMKLPAPPTQETERTT